MAEIVCNFCRKTFKTYRTGRKFCSNECYIKSHQPTVSKNELQEMYWNKNHSMQEIAKIVNVSAGTIHNWLRKNNITTRGKNPKQVICDYCGKEFLESPSRYKRNFKHNFCSNRCYGLSKRQRTSFICKQCCKEFDRTKCEIEEGRIHYCSHECFGEHHTGEKNNNWRGGWEPYYGPNWDRQRKKTLIRDNHKCIKCGVQERLIVHHKIPFRLFGRGRYQKANNLDNLTTLCVFCHKICEITGGQHGINSG